MIAAAAAPRVRSGDVLQRLLRLSEGERRLVLRGLTDAQRAEFAAREFGCKDCRA